MNYEDFLEAIGKTLQRLARSQKPEDRYLYARETYFSFDLDKVAERVALQFANSNNYPFELRDGLNFATIHTLELESKDTFRHQLQQFVVDVLKQQVEQKLSESPVNKTLADYARSLLVPVAQLSAQQAKGSSYSLRKEYTLEKKRLHVQPQKPDGMPWLKAHKLTLTVQKIDGFAQQITEGICELLVQKRCDEEDVEEVREVLQDEAKQKQSNLGQLQEILVKESVARIQRDAKVRYLRYLLKGIEEWKKRSIEGGKQGPQSAKDRQALHLFTLLIDRLEMLDTYIRQADRDTGYYQVTYQCQTFNYRDLFARADALNALPIITEIDGFLGESTDKERREKTFVSGIKMKLNGGVHAHGGEGRSVFKYNVALLNPESPEYKKRQQAARSVQSLWEKTLRTALLYCFVFCYMDDTTFRPDEYFEKHILPVLREGTEEQKIAVLKRLQQRIDTSAVTDNIDAIRDLLFNFLLQSK